MKRIISNFQPVFFQETIMVKKIRRAYHIFDLISKEETSGTVPETQLEYNICLLEKLISLSKIAIKPFLIYHSQQLEYPVIWIQAIRLMLDRNKEVLLEILPVDQLHQLNEGINEIEQNYDEFSLPKSSIVLDVPPNNKVSEKFDINHVKTQLSKMTSKQERLIYLHRIKTDYIQQYGWPEDEDEMNFVRQTDLEITFIQRLEQLGIDETDELPIITWNGPTNQLVAEFLRLKKTPGKNGKPLLISSIKGLVDLLHIVFRKIDGTTFNKTTLNTYVIPSNEHLLPKDEDDTS